MPSPTQTESDALKQSLTLLQFASGACDNLDPQISLAIAQAVEAEASKSWTADISQKFWHAFNLLCHMIKPVTLDSLSTQYPPKFTFWINFIALTFWSLVALPIQVYTWEVSTLSDRLTKLSAEMDARVVTLSQDTGQLETTLRHNNKDHSEESDLAALRLKVGTDTDAVADEARSLLDSAAFLQRLATLRYGEDVKQKYAASASRDNAESLSPLRSAKLAALQAQGNASVLTGIGQLFLLPTLLGAIGALAYVVRSISEQVRNRTFSSTSFLRNVSRGMLGALMGAVIGLFGDVSGKLNLSPLAVAFLAGYGVEAVFSMFDGLINRFKLTADPSGKDSGAKFVLTDKAVKQAPEPVAGQIPPAPENAEDN